MLDGISTTSTATLPGNDPLPRIPAGTQVSDTKLLSTAREFESILLGQWLQGAESSFGSVPGSEDDQDAGDDQMKGFSVQQLAKSLSASGGVGIAGLVSKALEKSAAASPKPSAKDGAT